MSLLDTVERLPLLLTEKEAAEILRYSVRTLQAWRIEGKGPPVTHVEGGVRYFSSKLLAWLEGNTAASGDCDVADTKETEGSAAAEAIPDADRSDGPANGAVSEQERQRARTECQAWLEVEMRKSPQMNPKTKAEWQTEARLRWPDLSERGFLWAWDSAVAKSGGRWSKPGRRPKSSRR